MSKRGTRLLIGDMLESANKFLAYTENFTFEQFLSDDKTKDAVVRNFEILGEAANRLPEEFRETTTEIDWNRLRGFRNRIVHAYFGIDYSIVWNIKEAYLPGLLHKLQKLSQ